MLNQRLGATSPRYRLAVALLVTTLAVLLASCSSAEPETDSRLGIRVDSLPAGQRAIVEDGVVEFAEYESAILAAVACARNAGLDVSDPQLDRFGKYYTFGYFGPGMTDDETLDIYDKCDAENLSAVDLLWSDQNQPSGGELTRLLEEVRSCLDDAVQDYPEDASADQLMAVFFDEPLSAAAELCFLQSPLFAG